MRKSCLMLSSGNQQAKFQIRHVTHPLLEIQAHDLCRHSSVMQKWDIWLELLVFQMLRYLETFLSMSGILGILLY